MVRFALIWAAGLIPAGLASAIFALTNHPFAAPAAALFAALLIGGWTAARQMRRAYAAAAPTGDA